MAAATAAAMTTTAAAAATTTAVAAAAALTKLDLCLAAAASAVSTGMMGICMGFVCGTARKTPARLTCVVCAEAAKAHGQINMNSAAWTAFAFWGMGTICWVGAVINIVFIAR